VLGKLSRLRFSEGIRQLLKLELSWQQFDALFNKLDTGRSGALTFQDFMHAFQPVATEQPQSQELMKILMHFGDVLLNNSVTLQELFEGFDQNGSGSISISEFCSLLRLIGASIFSKQTVNVSALPTGVVFVSCERIVTEVRR